MILRTNNNHYRKIIRINYFELTFKSKSSKFAKPDDAVKESGALGFGGAGLGGGFLACLGGNAGDGDSGA